MRDVGQLYAILANRASVSIPTPQLCYHVLLGQNGDNNVGAGQEHERQSLFH
jgi:hypothetical protein